MVGSLIIFVLFFRPRLLPETLVANSEVYGIIWQNERWSGEIRVTGDVLALPGVTVTVSPGTRILVENTGDKSNMDFIPIHQQFGVSDAPTPIAGIRHGEPFLDEANKISLRFFKLIATGTKEQPIIIDSAATSKSPYDLNTIFIASGALINVNLAHYRRLEVGSVTINNDTFTDIGECAVCISRASPTILNSTFDRSLRDYIWVERGSPLIEGNLFLSIKGNGIVVDPERLGAPKIIANDFQLPGQSAVYFLSGGEKVGGIITNNLFAAGDITIPCDSKVKIYQNHIKSNLNFIKSGNCAGQYQIGLNYWEISDPKSVIKERVIGTEPKFKVLIDGVLLERPKPDGRN